MRGPALAGAPGLPPAPSEKLKQDAKLIELAGSPAAHLHSADSGAAAVSAPSTPSSLVALTNDGEHVPLSQAKHSLASNGSGVGKEGSIAGSVADSSASSNAGGASGSLAQHYDADGDVILRLEFLRPTEMKAIIRAARGAVLAGLAMLIGTLVFRTQKPDEYYLRTNTVPIVNLAFGCPLLAIQLTCFLVFFYRVYRSNLSGKRWSHRRRRACTLAGIEVTLQLVNLVFYVLPNAYVMAHDCSWFHPVVLWAGFVRWTIWNSIFLMFWVQAHSSNPARGPYWGRFSNRSDAAIIDAPLWAHWHKLLLWCAVEAVTLSLTVVFQANTNQATMDPNIIDCRNQDFDCSWKPAPLVLLSLNITCLVVYWLSYTFYILRALNNLKHRPYSEFRMANVTVRVQIRMRSPSIMFFTLCIVCYGFVKLGTCSSYVISWFGYLPMQVVMTITAIANAYMSMPKRPLEASIPQARQSRQFVVWLQEFAWTEADVPRKLAERASTVDPGSLQDAQLAKEPMFCFEIAVKAMFWSFLVYDYAERSKGNDSEQEQVDAALALWDLEHFELFWERSLDTKAVVGWNEDTVVIAFRGTASFNNVRSIF
ncbi:hypothetical protein ABPG77_010986, partial [Micractinium sp. CCAP 211/92]